MTKTDRASPVARSAHSPAQVSSRAHKKKKRAAERGAALSLLFGGGSSTQRKQISKSRRNSLTSILPIYREPLVQSIRQTGDPGDGFEARLLPVAWIVFCGRNPTLTFCPRSRPTHHAFWACLPWLLPDTQDESS